MPKGLKLRCLMLAGKMKRVVSRQDKLNRTMTEAERLAAEVADELKTMVDALADEPAADDDEGSSRRRTRDDPQLIPAGLARSGEMTLDVQDDGARQVVVRLEVRREFVVGGRPAQLLKILWEESQRGHDGWKNAADIAALLPQQGGEPSSRHVISNLASRLRKDLARSGVDPSIVECDQNRGYRLALRTDDVAGREAAAMVAALAQAA